MTPIPSVFEDAAIIENPVLDGGIVGTEHAGFTGEGFINFTAIDGGTVSATFTGAAAETRSLDIRYALGATEPRALAIEVNGVIVEEFTFESTGSWTNWVTTSIEIPAVIGNNAIRLITIGDEGPNIDFFNIAPSQGSADAPSDAVVTTFQAEDLIFDGAKFQNRQDGFTGEGYVNFTAREGGFVAFEVDDSTTEVFSLEVRYALNPQKSRTLAIEVDGVVVGEFEFESTGSWTNWETVTIDVPADLAGREVRLVTIGDEGPNIDTISVVQSVASPTVPVDAEMLPFEAEDLLLDGAIVDSGHEGFTGEGYANFTAVEGGSIAFGFETDAAETTILDVRYALGGTNSRALAFEVNGVVVGEFDFVSTGGWQIWETVSIELPVGAGENVVRLITTGEEGPNIDSFVVNGASLTDTPVVPTTPVSPDAPELVLQAEDGILSGNPQVNDSATAAGGRHVDFTTAEDQAITWVVAAADDTNVNLDIAYALGGGASRTMALEINGVVVEDALEFTPTGGFETYESLSLTAAVTEGTNTIRLVATGESGPNVDQLTLQGNGVSVPAPVTTPTNPGEPVTFEVINSLQPIIDSPFIFHENSTNARDYSERTVEIANTTDEPLTINSIDVSGPFALVDPDLANGAVIEVGESLFVEVLFDTADFVENTADERVYDGTLTINTFDSAAPSFEVDLSGAFSGTGGASEIQLAGLFDLLNAVPDVDGFLPTIRDLQENDADGNRVILPGEVTVNVDGQEERAIFFQAADENAPILVQQVGAFHNPGGSNISLRGYDYDASIGGVTDLDAFSNETNLGILIHDGDFYNTILTPLRNTNAEVFSIEIEDIDGPFGIEVNGSGLQQFDDGRVRTRAFELFDEETGAQIEDVFLVAYDFAGNQTADYNDNIYLVSNIEVFFDGLEFDEISDGDGSFQNGDTDVALDASFTVTININDDDNGIDATTVNADTVQLFNLDAGVPVEGSVNLTAFQNAITFTPAELLNANTTYAFSIDGVQAEDGTPFEVVDIDFTTGRAAGPQEFENLFVETSSLDLDTLVTGLTFTDDFAKLYATTLSGELLRWDVDAEGNLSNQQSFEVNSEPHALIGLEFDPNNPDRLWFTDNTPIGSSETGLAENFSSKLSYLDIDDHDGAFTGTVTDFAHGFPRGARDHLFNSIDFGPDGALYANVGSLSTTGTFETPLSASTLRIDVSQTPPAGGFNVNTDEGYDPNADGAPVTVYAEGLRNAYDLQWHSNGHLYSANNGSIGGGGTPDDPSTPENEALSGVATQRDYLYDVQEGGYYGHPNATQGNFILAGGNPTAGVDPAEETLYPVGTLPDPDYDGFIFDFGLNRSPNGTTEYQTDNLAGAALNEVLIVGEWSGGDRLVGLELGADGQVVSNFVVADGFVNPIDVIVHEPTGQILVAEMSGFTGEITTLTLDDIA